jgi:hypothetical protein
LAHVAENLVPDVFRFGQHYFGEGGGFFLLGFLLRGKLALFGAGLLLHVHDLGGIAAEEIYQQGDYDGPDAAAYYEASAAGAPAVINVCAFSASLPAHMVLFWLVL